MVHSQNKHSCKSPLIKPCSGTDSVMLQTVNIIFPIVLLRNVRTLTERGALMLYYTLDWIMKTLKSVVDLGKGKYSLNCYEWHSRLLTELSLAFYGSTASVFFFCFFLSLVYYICYDDLDTNVSARHLLHSQFFHASHRYEPNKDFPDEFMHSDTHE